MKQFKIDENFFCDSTQYSISILWNLISEDTIKLLKRGGDVKPTADKFFFPFQKLVETSVNNFVVIIELLRTCF